MMVGRSTVHATPSFVHASIRCCSASATCRTLSSSAASSEFILVMMLVDVNATTRVRDGVTRCGSAPASKPTWAVQYRVETGGHASLSGVARSACSQSTFCSARRVRDTATGFSPASTSRSTIWPPTIPLAPMTMLLILPTRQALFPFGPFVNLRVGEELLAAPAAQANARPCKLCAALAPVGDVQYKRPPA